MPDSPLLVLGISLTPWPHPGLIQASASGGASGLQREHRLQAGQAGVWREATGKRRDKKPETEKKGTDQVMK